MLLPKPQKSVSLQPISLGIIKNQKQMQENTELQKDSISSQIETKPAPKRVKKSPSKVTQKEAIKQPLQKLTQKPQEQLNTSEDIVLDSPQENVQYADSLPDINVDLQSLSLPQESFNPLVPPKPSLTQSIRQKEENLKLENLPSRVLEELERLYGNNIYRMTKEQKDYIAESYFMNYAIFQQTADRMGYPKLAAYLKQQGDGVIEFTLYPDGHIEDVKILISTKYEALDESMRQVVELSAKNLKRPPVPIQIRLGGSYQIR